MARPEWRDRAKEQFWRRAVVAWRRSGLTIRDYCDLHALVEHNFYAWRRELARRDQQEGGRRKTPAPRPRRNQTATRRSVPAAIPPATTSFVPVRVRDDAAGDSRTLEIVLAAPGRERVVRVKPGFDRTTLAQVLAVLEDRPC